MTVSARSCVAAWFAAELVELSGEMRGDQQAFRVPDVLSGRQSALGPIEGGIRVAKCPHRARCITRADHLGSLSGEAIRMIRQE